MYGIIYKIENSVNSKLYIGQTIRSLQDRFQRHVQAALKGDYQSKIARAMRKYGVDNFSIQEIDTADTKQELNEKEKFYISFYNSIDNGYNIAKGGNGGDTLYGMSPERKLEYSRTLSKALKR